MKHGALALVLLATAVLADNPNKRVVVVLGDSIAAGAYVDNAKGTFTYRLTKSSHGDWFFLNASRSGATIAPGAVFPPVSPAMLGLAGIAGDDVLIMLGINDYDSNLLPADVAASVAILLDTATVWGMRKTCVTPVWRLGEEVDRNALGFALADYRAIIASTCHDHDALVIDGLDLIPHDVSLYASDGVHPNDRGHTYLAKRLYPALREAGW